MLKVLNIQDLSSYTKSSGNIALPLFEAANVDITLLPTSLLSTQTDGWPKLYKADLTKDAFEIAKVWKEEGISFDLVQVGYLASEEDFALIEYIFDNLLKKGGLIILDPVMGDNGEYYTEDRKALLPKLKALIKNNKSRMIITPNYTEACFLLGLEPIFDVTFDINNFMNRLKELSSCEVVVTSLPDNSNAYRKEDGFVSVPYHHYPFSYPGTGDLFTSLFAISLCRKFDIELALKWATKIASESVLYSKEKGREYRDGVLIHQAMRRVMEECV